MAFAGMLLRAGFGAAWGTAKLGARAGWGVTKQLPSIASAATNIGLFAVRHPYMTLGAVGAGMYLAGGGASPYASPSLSGAHMSLNINQELAAAELMNTGVAPMGGMIPGAVIRNQRLMESTNGLVQGLHRSRH